VPSGWQTGLLSADTTGERACSTWWLCKVYDVEVNWLSQPPFARFRKSVDTVVDCPVPSARLPPKAVA
jgi:hypothetical protein